MRILISVASLAAVAAGATSAPASGAARTTSSCPPMPTHAPVGYHVSVHDDFNGSAINERRWYRWAGEPGGDSYGWWKTPRTVASGGILSLRGRLVRSGGNPKWSGGGVVTSGIGSKHLQTYGQYEWCMRSDDMPGTETDVLLWPWSNSFWPPEIDLYESSGDASSYSTTIHFGSRQQNFQVQQQVSGSDATQWHVFLAVWTRGLVELYEDGTLVSSISDTVAVPNLPMRLDFQTQAIESGAAVGTTSVAWVVEFARNT